VAILNIDDERVIQMAQRAQCDVVTFGLDEAADFRAVYSASSSIAPLSNPPSSGR